MFYLLHKFKECLIIYLILIIIQISFFNCYIYFKKLYFNLYNIICIFFSLYYLNLLGLKEIKNSIKKNL